MKKILIVSFLSLSLFLVPVAMAQESFLPNPGITPNSPFYFLDTLGENIELGLTRSLTARAEKQMKISLEKLAEVKAMTETGDTNASEVAADRYGFMVSGAASNLSQAAKSGEGFNAALEELISLTTSISQTVLADVYQRVPEQAKPAIQKAMEASTNGAEEGLGAASETSGQGLQDQAEENLLKVRENLPSEVQQYIPTSIPLPDVPSNRPSR